MRLRLELLAISVAAALVALPAHGQPRDGTLRVVVKDPSGAVIPGAAVAIRGHDAAPDRSPIMALVTDGDGVALAPGLAPGRYDVDAAFPGFETMTVRGLRVRGGDNRRDITLPIQKVDENVAVGRDPETAASDPRNERFSQVLSKEQIDALPDDPDEMERVLKDMAGPGATIRVDGFRGGRLPPKAQIRSIRFGSGMFAAEHHGGGMALVDILTQPGMGPIQGSFDVTFRDDALNARHAFQDVKRPEGTQRYTFNLGGAIIENRTSFSLSAGGASLYESANILAALPDGSRRADAFRKSGDRLNVSGRLDHALTASHTLRLMFQQSGTDDRHLGVGGFELPERAYARRAGERLFRLSESGPWGKAWFGESRLQVRWSDSELSPAVEAPAERVIDAFTSGGAQQAGSRRGTEFEWAANVDWARGRHAVRFGALVEGGRHVSDARTNYLGTFTFASLADYAAGRPSTYTRRIGDPRVEYSHVQAGLFVQDDWRARRNLTLSAGLRQELQTHLGDRLNLAPRGGLSWSPFRSGRTTVRAGGGIFHEWLEAEVYEQTLRVDGERQQEIVVRQPAYPDPFAGGSAGILPASKYLLAPGLVMPERRMASAGIAQQLSPHVGLSLNVMHTRGRNRLRGRNINAPRGGVRPDPGLGSVTQVESTARMEATIVHAGANLSVPARRLFVFANYSFVDQRDDADGPFGLPADSYDPAADWGPAAGLPRHTLSAVVNAPLIAGVRLGVTALARSGVRYTITTGHDDNGDTVFTDRPAGVGRNSATGAGMWDVAARLSYTFGFGTRGDGPAEPGAVIVQRAAPGAGSAGDMLGGFMAGSGAEDKRIRIELFASAQNLFNGVALTGYSGVMTSPFFGQATSALPARRVDVGMRIGF